MKQAKPRKEKREARSEILRQLALWDPQDGPANKKRLEKATKTRRETLYGIIRDLKERKEIAVIGKETTNAGLISEQYALTERGLYSAAMLNPDLQSTIASRLGHKFTIFQENVVRSRLRNLEQWVKMARTILESGKALPNASMSMEIFANEHGQVAYRQSFDPWGLAKKRAAERKSKLRRLSEDEFEKLVAVGGGRVDSKNLTPEQEVLLRSFSAQD